MAKIFISAGDYSGDIHASRLMRQIKLIAPDTEFEGIGGDMMAQEGLKSIIPLGEISVVGFVEVARKYNTFKKLLNESKKMLKTGNYDALITVDYPGFNLRLARYAKSINILTCQYIAPQAWAWGKDRAKELSNYIDLLLVVFPFEEDFFQNYNINAKFIGHPLMDDEAFEKPILELEERNKIMAFLPGSRIQEIRRHGKLYTDIIQAMKRKRPDYRFIIAKTSSISQKDYEKYFSHSDIEFSSDSRELMRTARAGIVKTGTSTLEAALCGMPFSMIYKTSAFTYQYGKYVVNLPYLSLVNILMSQEVIKEFVQGQATRKKISIELDRIIDDTNYTQKMVSSFKELRHSLGSQGASKLGAKEIMDLVLKRTYK